MAIEYIILEPEGYDWEDWFVAVRKDGDSFTELYRERDADLLCDEIAKDVGVPFADLQVFEIDGDFVLPEKDFRGDHIKYVIYNDEECFVAAAGSSSQTPRILYSGDEPRDAYAAIIDNLDVSVRWKKVDMGDDLDEYNVTLEDLV